MLKNDIELLNGSESWNRTLAQTLIPDFQPLKENSMLGSKSLENGYATRASSNPPPDIQSSHFTISPIKHELVHVDLLEGKGRKVVNSGPFQVPIFRHFSKLAYRMPRIDTRDGPELTHRRVA